MMEDVRWPLVRHWLGALVLGLSMGCAGNPLSIQPIPVTSNPSAQVQAFSEELNLAQQKKVPLMSPSWYSKAEASYAAAKKTLDEGGSVQEILGRVATGRAQLAEAQNFTKISETTFPAVIKAREDARAAGATSLGESYSEVEEQFLELTAAVEGDSLAWAQRKAPSVEKAYRGVELKAIQETTGNQIEALITKARSEGAEKLTPDLLKQTESQFQALEKFISQNRYASKQIGERAKDALFQANRLVYLTQEAKTVRGETVEARLLKQEAGIASVAQGLSLPDLRDQSFVSGYEQLAAAGRELRRDRDSLVARVDALRGEIDGLNEKVASLEGRSSAERAQLAALESERRFEELYDIVSASFNPEEAEVYKQGAKLVIRLRSIDFPVGQYVIQPASYSLLSKVQQAIRAFGDPDVVIEGHTDSTGSKELNDHLSQMRAEAVAEYLVANNTLPRDDITAIGMGFSDPLATNNTSEGRTLNRRIDVVIDAQHGPRSAAVSAGN